MSSSSSNTIKVCNTELGDSDFVIDSPSAFTEDADYEIDASATTLLANMTNHGNPNPDSYLPSEDYSSLTPEERDLWRKIPPNMKSIILKGRNSNNRPNNRCNVNKTNNPSYKTIKSPPYYGKPFTKAKLHEILNELIVDINESKDSSFVVENAMDKNESTLLANLTTARKLNPGDIRNMLSTLI